MTTHASTSFARKLQSAIIKPPPRTVSISMIALNKDEADSSALKSGISAQIFPKSFSDAKVFIGFPTKQTTALKSHIAAPQAIPTMERAAVDTANAYVKDWNKEMMYMAGVLARIVYGTELQYLESLLSNDLSKLSASILDKTAHIMNQFYFDSSTPDPKIGQYIATGFWKSASTIPLLTSKGMKPSDKTRLMDDITFLKDVPIIPPELYNKAKDFLDQVKVIGMIRPVDFTDIKNEFGKRSLDRSDTKSFLQWLAKKVQTDKISLAEAKSIMTYAVVADEELGAVDLRSIIFYHNTGLIPESMPVPFTCLPYAISKELNRLSLEVL